MKNIVEAGIDGYEEGENFNNTTITVSLKMTYIFEFYHKDKNERLNLKWMSP